MFQNNQLLKNNDPIAAIATPPGEGAIAVIRLSGPNSLTIADLFFSKKISTCQTHTAHYGKILDSEKKTLDHVLLLLMKGPRSYTGEDTVEIFCHGGNLIAQKVLTRVYQLGARPAEPGEFSLRAFLNGKIDLAQAEAVQTMIAAKNEQAMKQAEKQLEGVLSKTISSFQKELTEIAAILEASVDFPEEDLQFSAREEMKRMLETSYQKMERLQKTFSDGKILQSGISLCLIGAPNVGKSSLMNALLGYNRAIVTEIAGTTRDLIQEDLRLGNLHFRLIDTAGIRETDELIEQEGIRRSTKAMNDADLILIILDASRPLHQNESTLLQTTPEEKRVVVWNKIDLGSIDPTISPLGISAKKQLGLDLLKQAIEQKIWKEGAPEKDQMLITNLRHYQALTNAMQNVQIAIEGISNQAFPELIAADVRSSLHELGTILGTNVTEEILSAIFSKFCLGK
ncbi:MAG: tRNA uridine-5-carboxymethylaminomethyl(34) synthesis GTPase MnmE [Chlamydiia bacterium]|nr:tRNA uridine-5-carboxymethylaminomethyl(34) synthesis GTPase MnmE [Chlamydiia bacterium]